MLELPVKSTQEPKGQNNGEISDKDLWFGELSGFDIESYFSFNQIKQSVSCQGRAIFFDVANLCLILSFSSDFWSISSMGILYTISYNP